VSQVSNVGRAWRARELCRAAHLLVGAAQSQAVSVLVAVAAAIYSRRSRKRDYAMRGFFSQILRFVCVVKHRVGQLIGGGAGGSRALRQRQHADGIEGRNDEISAAGVTGLRSGKAAEVIHCCNRRRKIEGAKLLPFHISAKAGKLAQPALLEN
jgi:hypothetical protein